MKSVAPSTASGRATLITASVVAPVCSPPLPAGWVVAQDGRIAATGSGKPPPADERCDFPDCIITPGLVNPHTHLELSCYADRIAPAPFYSWLLELIRLRGGADLDEREQAGAVRGAWDSLRAGVTCVGDISRRNTSWRVLRELPIRAVCFAELLSLADMPPRTPEELRSSIDAMQPGPLQRIGITPHASYSVRPDHFRSAVGLAGERRLAWTTHWCETAEELTWMSREECGFPLWFSDLLRRGSVRSPGVQQPGAAGAHLRSLVGDGPRGLLAHVNYATDEDIERLAADGHAVAFCPRAHRFFGHAPHPLPRLRAAGVPVVFGTDSRASNWSLSILEELRTVRALPPGTGAGEDAAALLRAATFGAATALGWDDEIGTLDARKAADIAVFPLAGPSADPVEALIGAAPAARAVWIAGRRVEG